MIGVRLNIIGFSNGKGRNFEAVRTKISCLCCTTNDRLEYRREGLPLCDSDWSTVSLYRLEIRKRTGCSQNNSYVRSLITEDCSNVTRLFFLFSSKTRTVPKKRRAILISMRLYFSQIDCFVPLISGILQRASSSH